jgi:transposase
MKRPKRLDFTPEQVEALIVRIENQQLHADDFPLLADILRAMIWMEGSLKEKSLSIKRLQTIFGVKTESAKKLAKLLQQTSKEECENTADDTSSDVPSSDTMQLQSDNAVEKDDETEKDSKKKKPSKGHGHRPASDYEEAKIIGIAHETLKKGSFCPKCCKGKLYSLSPGTVLRITGQPWLNVEIYKPERLRCSVCQEIFTAKLPEDLYKGSRVDKTGNCIDYEISRRGPLLSTRTNSNYFWQSYF